MEVFWQNLQQKLDSRGQFNGNRSPCRVWIGAVDQRGYGRIVVKWPNGHSTTERVHRVALMVKYRWLKTDFPRKDIDGKTLEVSHLCHNKLCFNTEHLVIETHEANQSRNHCKLQNQCSGGHRPSCLL